MSFYYWLLNSLGYVLSLDTETFIVDISLEKLRCLSSSAQYLYVILHHLSVNGVEWIMVWINMKVLSFGAECHDTLQFMKFGWTVGYVFLKRWT